MTDKKNQDFLLGEIYAKVQDIPHIKEKVECLDRKVAKLEVKSSIWGALAGMLSAVMLYLSMMWKKLFD